METYTIRKAMSDEQADALAGTLLGPDSYDQLFTDNVRLVREDGSPLLVFVKKALKADDCANAYLNLRDAAATTDNRGMAAGKDIDYGSDGVFRRAGRGAQPGESRYYPMKQDGTVSKTNRAKPVQSGIVGYFDRNPRYPYCRLTAYNLNAPDKFRKALPMIRAVDKVFAEHVPDRYLAQKQVVEATSTDFYISGTVFTTLTVNMNFQTAVHKDVGDYKPGFGVLSALRAGKYEGCYFCLPQYRVAVDMETADVLLVDVHEWHGNTPLIPRGRYERLSLVFYYREKMKECGTATEELERTKRRQAGQPMSGKGSAG